MTPELLQRTHAAHERLRDALVAEQGPSGSWVGELSSSPLSTATAVIALATVDAKRHDALIRKGLTWLANHANADGGWGDTTRSRSNLSTTALVWAALGVTHADGEFPQAAEGATLYISNAAGTADQLVPAIEALYGKDRTFSVPITMTLALCGRLGADGWRRVRPLPFELAALPRGVFGALRLPVVSYALPALIAIGQVIHQRSGRFHPLRSWTRARTLAVLESLQPSNGGFLEATPLTSFVTMSLAGMGLAHHTVAQKGVAFLIRSVRKDGSWPIDTNLATWVTTLAVNALDDDTALTAERRDSIRTWLLGQQYRVEHPYTGAAPGGWAWTDLPGGVPDADDTAGALNALLRLGKPHVEALRAGTNGVTWLLDLQNGDGGIPTFCRGWGALPFDRSTPELTAHALNAWGAWRPHLPGPLAGRVDAAAARAVKYLIRSQRTDGAWLPLWFGNEAAPAQENPVYGTANVLPALTRRVSSLQHGPEGLAKTIDAGMRFLAEAQNSDGGWGGDRGVASSIEETALALAALAGAPGAEANVERGTAWLVAQIESNAHHTASPIGLYFARLWYHERLYPVIFALRGLRRVLGSAGGSG